MIRVRLSLQSPALEAGVKTLLEADSGIRVVSTENLDAEAADVHILTSAALARLYAANRGERLAEAVLVLGASALDLQTLWNVGVSWGVLPDDASGDELRAAVHAVAAGMVVGPRALLRASEDMSPEPGPLSEREIEVLGMLLRGLANKQIASELGISEHTVKFHVSSIYTKLSVSNRTEAVREGLRNGWITL